MLIMWDVVLLVAQVGAVALLLMHMGFGVVKRGRFFGLCGAVLFTGICAGILVIDTYFCSCYAFETARISEYQMLHWGLGAAFFLSI